MAAAEFTINIDPSRARFARIEDRLNRVERAMVAAASAFGHPSHEARAIVEEIRNDLRAAVEASDADAFTPHHYESGR